MTEKSESFFKDYLKKIPDKDIRQYYNDVEWTPFPVLVIKEYQNRFKPKNKITVQKKLEAESVISKKKGQIIREILKQKRSDAKQFKNDASKIISNKIKDAKMTWSSEHNLKLLEKLADLKDKGIITSSEFQQKKKKILEKI